ncbi:bidirectional sugar transporter SWEET4-like protein [Carex littledalei]|uniref:Bidirectional sugar transporter SWEET4-like protein n=1 Tax=Carex littledalei TaxID=544730 RepID=A0A833RBN2_9POAL|nr:bidirectional sugar transporter SWEET4-like protein [Carex littledalei]
MEKKKSVEQFSPIPYIATLVNCMMWVLCGLPIVHPHSILVITINGAGMLIEISYILLFILYSQGRTRLQVLLMFVASIISVAVIASLVIMLAHTHERRSMIVGIICVVLCIIMYAAPLSVMKQHKSGTYTSTAQNKNSTEQCVPAQRAQSSAYTHKNKKGVDMDYLR